MWHWQGGPFLGGDKPPYLCPCSLRRSEKQKGSNIRREFSTWLDITNPVTLLWTLKNCKTVKENSTIPIHLSPLKLFLLQLRKAYHPADFRSEKDCCYITFWQSEPRLCLNHTLQKDSQCWSNVRAMLSYLSGGYDLGTTVSQRHH